MVTGKKRHYTPNEYRHKDNKHRRWKKQIWEKDNYTCTICGSHQNLTADHIIPRSISPKLAYDITNGRTLCEDCRRKDEKESLMNGKLKK
jgi:5-methylcytosine-specific restriction endonuclease McrA